jgi:hypothetical protein
MKEALYHSKECSEGKINAHTATKKKGGIYFVAGSLVLELALT